MLRAKNEWHFYCFIAHGPNIPRASATVDALCEASVRRTMIGIGSPASISPPPAGPVAPDSRRAAAWSG